MTSRVETATASSGTELRLPLTSISHVQLVGGERLYLTAGDELPRGAPPPLQIDVQRQLGRWLAGVGTLLNGSL